MFQKHTVALVGLTAIVLVLTGSAVRSSGSSSFLKALGPIILPALFTWYLLMLLAYSKTITEILSGFLLTGPKGEGSHKRSLLAPIIAALVVIGLGSLLIRPEFAATLATVLQQVVGLFITKPGASSQASNTIGAAGQPASSDLFFYYTVLIFGGIVVVSFSLIGVSFFRAYAERRTLPVGQAGEHVRREMLQSVQEARSKLSARDTYPETILSCYRRMCRILSDNGHSILPTETAREFAQGISTKLELGSDSVLGLTFLFEEARYSNHRLRNEKRELAVNYLSSLEQALLSDGVKA